MHSMLLRAVSHDSFTFFRSDNLFVNCFHGFCPHHQASAAGTVPVWRFCFLLVSCCRSRCRLDYVSPSALRLEMSTVMRIAIVEDHEDNRSMLHIFLENQRYRVTSYSSGQEALPGMRAEKPDLLLCDISLPDIDGPSILREMRLDDALSQVPVIAVTAHAM